MTNEIIELRELMEENLRLTQEVLDNDLDRVMTWREIAAYCNYSAVYMKVFADEMSPVMRNGKRIGARKRNVISWLKQHEKKQGGLEKATSSGS